jgi:hypothetical protein
MVEVSTIGMMERRGGSSIFETPSEKDKKKDLERYANIEN